MKERFYITLGGALIGMFLGGGTGVAGAFGGVSGLLVFSVIGGIIGFFATPDFLRIMKFFNKNKHKG